MDITTRLAIHAAIIVVKRLPWWFYAALAVSLFPAVWQAWQRDQALAEKAAATLAAPPPPLEDLSPDSAVQTGSSGTEVAFRAQVIDALSGPIEQKVGAVDVSKFVIFLAPPDATGAVPEVVAAIVVPLNDRAQAEDWIARQTITAGELGALIEVRGLRSDASAGIAQTKLLNLLYPGATKEFQTRRKVDLGNGQTTEITEFDSAGFEARIAPLTSRFMGITPFFESREASLTNAGPMPIRAYQLHLVLIAFLVTLAVRRWRRRSLPASNSAVVAFVNKTMQRWITIFCAIWAITALGKAYDIGRIGDVAFRVLIFLGMVGFVAHALLKRSALKDLSYAELVERLKHEARKLSETRPALPVETEPRPIRMDKPKPSPASSDPFADSPIKTSKGWFR